MRLNDRSVLVLAALALLLLAAAGSYTFSVKAVTNGKTLTDKDALELTMLCGEGHPPWTRFKTHASS